VSKSEASDVPVASSTATELTESQLTKYAETHAEEIASQWMREGARLWERADSFSTWATAAGGASIGVAITQLTLIRTAIGVGGTRALLWTLAVSVLAGLFSKYLAFSLALMSAMNDMNSKISAEFLRDRKTVLDDIYRVSSSKLIEKYIVPLVLAYLKEMRPAIPAPFRYLLSAEAAKKALGSGRQSEARYLRKFLWQLGAVAIQILFLMAAVVIAACAV
jgi:hypothetical protein